MKNFFIVFGSAFLIISGASDISARSQGSSSWEYETSLASLKEAILFVLMNFFPSIFSSE